MAKALDTQYYPGVGRRKSAVAQVRIMPGTGQFSYNNEKAAPKPAWIRPLQLVGRNENTDVSIVVRGGGYSSRDDAIILGIARALIELDNGFKSTLRKAGLVTRDPRVKERKKPGLKRARKAPQWSKR
jgi:small subunit ribosomal protein S9